MSGVTLMMRSSTHRRNIAWPSAVCLNPSPAAKSEDCGTYSEGGKVSSVSVGQWRVSCSVGNTKGSSLWEACYDIPTCKAFNVLLAGVEGGGEERDEYLCRRGRFEFRGRGCEWVARSPVQRHE